MWAGGEHVRHTTLHALWLGLVGLNCFHDCTSGKKSIQPCVLGVEMCEYRARTRERHCIWPWSIFLLRAARACKNSSHHVRTNRNARCAIAVFNNGRCQSGERMSSTRRRFARQIFVKDCCHQKGPKVAITDCCETQHRLFNV